MAFETLTTALMAAFIVSVVSFVGLLTIPLHITTRRHAMMLAVSFASGTMLAAVFFDLLPESVKKGGENAFAIALAGMVVFFIIEKVLHWHHHHEIHHELHHSDDYHPSPGHRRHKHHRIEPMGYLNLIGDAIHNFLDGIMIAASFIISTPLGLVTTLAVIFHEIPQEIGDFFVLRHAGFSLRQALTVNFITALTAMIGTAIPFLLAGQISNLEGTLLPFATGGMLYLAAADLLPELLHDEIENRSLMLILPFVLGIAIIWLFSKLFAV